MPVDESTAGLPGRSDSDVTAESTRVESDNGPARPRTRRASVVDPPETWKSAIQPPTTGGAVADVGKVRTTGRVGRAQPLRRVRAESLPRGVPDEPRTVEDVGRGAVELRVGEIDEPLLERGAVGRVSKPDLRSGLDDGKQNEETRQRHPAHAGRQCIRPRVQRHQPGFGVRLKPDTTTLRGTSEG